MDHNPYPGGVPASEEVVRQAVEDHADAGCAWCRVAVTLDILEHLARGAARVDALLVASLVVEAAERIAAEAGERE